MTPETQKELSASGYDVTPISAEKREQLAQNLTKEEYERSSQSRHGSTVLRQFAR